MCIRDSSSDIYYQGTSNKELPVDMKIKYYLDDQEITPVSYTHLGRPRRKVLYRRLIMKGYERKSIMHESDDIVPEDICGDFEVE